MYIIMNNMQFTYISRHKHYYQASIVYLRQKERKSQFFDNIKRVFQWCVYTKIG